MERRFDHSLVRLSACTSVLYTQYSSSMGPLLALNSAFLPERRALIRAHPTAAA